MTKNDFPPPVRFHSSWESPNGATHQSWNRTWTQIITPRSFDWLKYCLNLTVSFLSREAIPFVKSGADRIGHVYKKAIFKQFIDKTFSQEIAKPSWLGFLGPVLRAEERDTFIIHLKNFASRPYSVHPHGVFYEKDSEGKTKISFLSLTLQSHWIVFRRGLEAMFKWVFSCEAP